MKKLGIIFYILFIVFLFNHNAFASEKQYEKKISINMTELANITSNYGKVIKMLFGNKEIKNSELLNNIILIQSGMKQIEKLLHTQYNDFLIVFNTLAIKNDVKHLQERFNDRASYILYQFKKLSYGLNNKHGNVMDNSTLQEFARENTGHGSSHIPNLVREFFELIVPNINPDSGLLDLYSHYVQNLEERHEWCNNEQSLNEFIYKSFEFTSDVITKGYLTILESYAIRQSFNQGNFTTEIRFLTNEYETAMSDVAKKLNKLVKNSSTKLRRCDPPHQQRGKTYLEMEKLFQGIITDKLTMNSKNSGYWDCESYKDEGAGYYPYPGIRNDGDWKCHGLTYNCFQAYSEDLCKPTTPNRRYDGIKAKNRKDWMYGEKVAPNFGNLTNCNNNEILDIWWSFPIIWTTYDTDKCGCICDDLQHPKTLRNFSRNYVVSDYKNNMVITGLRLVNIKNVIHIEIQQGKLEEFGFINSSTVNWRSQSEIMKENVNSPPRQPISLSYHKRRINLDKLDAQPADILIGVTFEWDREEKGLVLSALVTNYSYHTGKLDLRWMRWISNNNERTEIKLDNPHRSDLCTKNIPIRETNKYIKFQTSDWIKDAAQTTIPYLDIQEIVTKPPTVLRGVGLNYKKCEGHGGYIGLELYSHDYTNFIYYNRKTN